MGKALELAEEALLCGEFPVGAVVVKEGRIAAAGARSGSAQPEANELDHAEMLALKDLAARSVSASGATIYCTMEPCLMCFGAILLAGIGRIVYAYEDVMGGGASIDPEGLGPLYRQRRPRIVSGVRRAESLSLFVRFFENPQNGYWAGSLLARYTLDQALGSGT